MTTAFGRYLHSLTAPVQVLVRAERLDLSAQIAELYATAPHLPHPALEAAAREHADYLAQLRQTTDLLRRQVLLIVREPVRSAGPADPLGGSGLRGRAARRGKAGQAEADDAPRRVAETRLMRRVGEAVELLHPVGITITPLDAGQATAVLAAACNPDSLLSPSSHLAGADDVITTAPLTEEDAVPASAVDHPRTDHDDQPSDESEDGARDARARRVSASGGMSGGGR